MAATWVRVQIPNISVTNDIIFVLPDHLLGNADIGESTQRIGFSGEKVLCIVVFSYVDSFTSLKLL